MECKYQVCYRPVSIESCVCVVKDAVKCSVVGQAEYGLGFGPCSLLSGLLGLRVVFYFYTVIEPILQFA